MNPDPVPPVRPLLTHVIPGDLVRREAGLITLLLDERPTLAFELLTPAYGVSPRATLQVVLLEVRVEALAACQSKAGIGSRESVVGEPNLLEDVVLLGLERGDLVGETRGTHLTFVVAFEVGDESPVVQPFCLLEEDGVGLRVSGEEAGEPRGNGVRHGLTMVGGGGV